MFDLKSLRNALLLPGLALALGFGAGAASATDGDDPAAAPGPQQLAQADQFSDEDIESFVAARESVIDISRNWEERIQNAESQDELNSLQQASQEEMIEAIRDEGLTVNDYNMMVDAAQRDPDLQQRISEVITQ